MIGKLIAVALASAAAGLAVALMPAEQTEGALLRPGDSETVARGDRIYGQYCASCHGKNLEGEPNWRVRDESGLLPAPPHNETGHTAHHPDQLLFAITKEGVAKASGIDNYKTKMPAYGETLTDDEIIAVLSYVKSTWPDEMRERHDELNSYYAMQERE